MGCRTFSVCVPGPKYAKKGWPCQDFSCAREEGGLFAAAVVADGHGSGNCFRSQLGARFAVDAALEQLRAYCDEDQDAGGTDREFALSENGIDNLKYDLWQSWRKKVREHWDGYLAQYGALSDEEPRFAAVSKKYRLRYTSPDPDVVERYLYRAYGTTMLLAVVVRDKLLLLQIGDGSCVVLLGDGEFLMPVPPDEENFLNVTVSLCDEQACQKFRHAVLDWDTGDPSAAVAVFLSSDGVDDCFPIFENETYLYKLYAVILDNMIQYGFEDTLRELETSLLPSMTGRGSQDDISLAGIVSPSFEVLRDSYGRIDDALKPE